MKGIHKEVNIRQWKLIFWTCLVQIAKVHITPNLVILFLHGYYVEKSLGVLDGLDKTSCQQLLDFLSYLSFYISVKNLS